MSGGELFFSLVLPCTPISRSDVDVSREAESGH